LPRRRKRPRPEDVDGSVVSTATDDLLVAVLIPVLVAIVAILVILLLPYVVLLLELLFLPFLFVYRVMLGKPWTVEARSGSERLRWNVVGWRRAGEAAAEIRGALERGERPEPRGATRL
jgi:hypothetical protein